MECFSFDLNPNLFLVAERRRQSIVAAFAVAKRMNEPRMSPKRKRAKKDSDVSPLCDPRTKSIAKLTTIADLNDDCLLELCEYMDLSDLCTFADVCHQFQRIAGLHFGSVKCLALRHVDMNALDHLSVRTKCSFLRNFGPLFNSLQIEASGYNDQFWINVIMQYCLGDGALAALTLNGCFIDEETGLKLPSLLHNLTTLRMERCIVADRLGFLRNFPKLEEFTDDFLDDDEFGEFLMMNPQMKRIGGACGYFRFVQIVDHLPLIEHLCTFVFSHHEFLTKITSLKKIKVLTLLPSVTECSLSKLKEICKNLCELQELSLKSRTISNMDGLKEIIRIAPNLQIIRMPEMTLSMNADEFRQIVDIIKRRDEGNRLTITLVVSEMFRAQLRVPQIVRDEFQHLLAVEIDLQTGR